MSLSSEQLSQQIPGNDELPRVDVQVPDHFIDPDKIRIINGEIVSLVGSRACSITDYRSGRPETRYYDTDEERRADPRNR